MKKDILLSIAAIEAAPQRSEGIADSAVQMFIKGLLLMLQNKKPQPSKNENCGL